MVFDDLFDTVIRTKDNENVFNKIYYDLFDFNRDWYSEYEHEGNSKLIYRPPSLEDVCLDEQDRRKLKHDRISVGDGMIVFMRIIT